MDLLEPKIFPLRLDPGLHRSLAETAKKNNRSMQAEVMEALGNALPEFANAMVGLSVSDGMYFDESPRKIALQKATAYARDLSEECSLLEQWLSAHRTQLSCAISLQQKLLSFSPTNPASSVWHSVAIPDEDMLKKQKPPEGMEHQETFRMLKVEQHARHRAKELMLARYKSSHRLTGLMEAISRLNSSEPAPLK